MTRPDPVDVAVLGAGITGLTLGLALARAGVPTAVVDPGLTPGTPDGLMAGTASLHQELQHHHVWRWLGTGATRAYAEQAARGQRQVLAHAGELGVRVWRRPMATITGDGHEAFWLRHEARAERLAGLEPEFTDTTGLPMATRPQLLLDAQPVVDVVAYRDGLADALVAAGGALVTEAPQARRRVQTAADVSGLPVALRARVRAVTWRWRAFAAPHPVGRDTCHLDDGGRLVIGVGDELWVGSRADDGAAWVARYYDDPPIVRRWSALTAATFDAAPLVGPSGRADEWLAVGFGPWELTLGTAAALQLAEHLTTGADLPWSPRRLPRAAAVGRALWGTTRHAMRISAVTPFPRRG